MNFAPLASPGFVSVTFHSNQGVAVTLAYITYKHAEISQILKTIYNLRFLPETW